MGGRNSMKISTIQCEQKRLQSHAMATVPAVAPTRMEKEKRTLLWNPFFMVPSESLLEVPLNVASVCQRFVIQKLGSDSSCRRLDVRQGCVQLGIESNV